jgi:hypothetical protein
LKDNADQEDNTDMCLETQDDLAINKMRAKINLKHPDLLDEFNELAANVRIQDQITNLQQEVSKLLGGLSSNLATDNEIDETQFEQTKTQRPNTHTKTHRTTCNNFPFPQCTHCIPLNAPFDARAHFDQCHKDTTFPMLKNDFLRSRCTSDFTG